MLYDAHDTIVLRSSIVLAVCVVSGSHMLDTVLSLAGINATAVTSDRRRPSLHADYGLASDLHMCPSTQ